MTITRNQSKHMKKYFISEETKTEWLDQWTTQRKSFSESCKLPKFNKIKIDIVQLSFEVCQRGGFNDIEHIHGVFFDIFKTLTNYNIKSTNPSVRLKRYYIQLGLKTMENYTFQKLNKKNKKSFLKNISKQEFSELKAPQLDDDEFPELKAPQLDDDDEFPELKEPQLDDDDEFHELKAPQLDDDELLEIKEPQLDDEFPGLKLSQLLDDDFSKLKAPQLLDDELLEIKEINDDILEMSTLKNNKNKSLENVFNEISFIDDNELFESCLLKY